MGDQLRWWKLWVSALDDDGLARLPLEDVARWCLLGAWLRQHGHGGTATLSRPGHALAKPWRQRRWEHVQATLHRLPNVITEVVAKSHDGQAEIIRISMRNWRKYQEDSSVQRTRTWRERQRLRDGQQSVTGDGLQAVTRDDQQSSQVTEQTRRDETVPPTPVGGTVTPSPAGARRFLAGYRYPDDFRGTPSRPLDPEAVVLIDPARPCTDKPWAFSNVHPGHVHQRECRSPRSA